MCKQGIFEHSSGLIEKGVLIESPLDFILDRNFYVINGDWYGLVTYEDGEYYLNIKDGDRFLLNPKSDDMHLVIRYEAIKSDKELELEEKYVELNKLELNKLELEIYALEQEIRTTSGFDESDDDIPF